MKKCICVVLLLLHAGVNPSFYSPLVSNLDLVYGTGSATFTRSFAGTVKDYNNNVVTCAIAEARLEGARRVHENRWSSYGVENAIEFDGADDDVKIDDNSAIQNIADNGASWSFWVNPKSGGGGRYWENIRKRCG